MKKILLTLIVAFIATNAFSQSVDWSVTSILSPTELQSTNQGTTISLDVVLTNLGTDSVAVGDSIYVQWAITNIQNQAIILYPGSTINDYAVILAKKIMKMGDTMHYSRSFSSNLISTPTTSVKVFFTSLIVNRKRGLKFESSITNNSKNNTITWFNVQKWGLNISQNTNSAFQIYPNPAKNNTSISLNIIDINANINLAIIDVMGQVVFSNSYSNIENINLNTSNLSKGIYFVKINNGSQNYTSKLIVE